MQIFLNRFFRQFPSLPYFSSNVTHSVSSQRHAAAPAISTFSAWQTQFWLCMQFVASQRISDCVQVQPLFIVFFALSPLLPWKLSQHVSWQTRASAPPTSIFPLLQYIASLYTQLCAEQTKPGIFVPPSFPLPMIPGESSDLPNQPQRLDLLQEIVCTGKVEFIHAIFLTGSKRNAVSMRLYCCRESPQECFPSLLL